MLIKLSAKLNIEKYLTQTKSITLSLNTLSIQFPIAQARMSQNETCKRFCFLVSVSCFNSLL